MFMKTSLILAGLLCLTTASNELVRVKINFTNSVHVGEVGFGNPPQNLQISFATGSSEVWVISPECKGSPCDGKSKFNSKISTTYHSDGKQVTMRSGVFLVGGTVTSDDITFGDIQLKQQKFLAVNDVQEYIKFNSDGFMGLGLKPSSITGKPPLANMVEKNLISKPIFSFYLSPTKGQETKTGEVIFGGSDPKHYSGDLHYVPLTSDTAWQFHATNISANDETACTNGCEVHIDTGSNFITGPLIDIQTINTAMGALVTPGGEYPVNCNTSMLPVVNFVINGKTFALEPEYYVVRVDKDKCISGFYPGEFLHSPWTINNFFLRKYYTEFDFTNKKIGFAPAV